MIKNVLIDVDGVLWEGGEQIIGAQQTLEFLEKNNYNFLFLTNISRFTVNDLSKKLKEKGISAIEEKIMSPIETTIEFVKSINQNAICFLIAENSIKEQFRKSGLKVVEKEERADVVVLFLYEKTDYGVLNTAFRILLNGAELIANTDLKHAPFTDKKPSIATGAFVKALEFVSEKKAVLTGKPNPVFFKQALKKLGAKNSETLMVGDTLSTDIAGAIGVGVKSVLVKTGCFNESELEKSVLKPDAVIDSIADLPNFLNSKGE